MGSNVLPLVILGAAGAAIYSGIADPEGGTFAGLGRMLHGEPAVRTPHGMSFLDALNGEAASGSPLTGDNPMTQLVPPAAYTATGIRAQVLAVARTWLGVPYVWGGLSSHGVDCSGLTARVYATVGVNLPHVSALQARMGRRRSLAKAAPGDLVFFATRGLVHHVGIYVGGSQILHAPHPGAFVRVEAIATVSPGDTITVRDVLTSHTHHTSKGATSV